MEYKFPDLPYAFDALEPYIDRMTMEIHYTKHHKAYFDKFTAGIKDTDLDGQPLETIFKDISKLPALIRNNGGGLYNHSLFWEILSPNGKGEAIGQLGNAINQAFGSLDSFKAKFGDAAANRFGSGWAWLLVDNQGKLTVSSSPNQDNPLMDIAEIPGKPILGLDVWEHAYYLKYQNRRPDYINAFWNVVNWEKANEIYETIIG
ncbi:MAG: superoxide dismutase [Bacteroidetes bacterium]|nr:superoxide dismutase [Bacteroidota bacterium]